MLDIAQNSVRAGAALIEIVVSQSAAEDRLVIQVIDNGCGMDAAQVARVTDPFFTTRTTRRVGLGVPFFKMAAELTGGQMTIRSTPGQGTTVHAVFVPSHIDCMPLGDMCETVCALIQCNPDIDFVYTREHNGSCFTADTRQLKEILEGVPIHSPEVMQFVKSYIDENTQALSGINEEESKP